MSPDERIEHFLNRICCHIRWPFYRTRIRRELTDHILTSAAHLHEAHGFCEDEAVAQAILLLGDPDEIGHALCQIRRPWQQLLCLFMTALLWCAIAFCAIYLLLHLLF